MVLGPECMCLRTAYDVEAEAGFVNDGNLVGR